MRRASILFIFVLLLLIPSAASAQALSIDTMQISIWPEYDRPDVLVIYQFTLADDVILPAQMILHIPASSGGPYNLAYSGKNEKGEATLINLDYETREQGEWLEISFSAPAPSIQLEYYDPGILRKGDTREFLFTWSGDYTVQSLALQMRQPVNATNVKIEPDLGDSDIDKDDQVYHSTLLGKVMAGRQFEIRLSYDKPDSILASGYDQVYAAEGNVITRQTIFQNALPWALGSLGILLITIAVVWYLVPNRESLSLHDRLRIVKHEKQPESPPVYCHNCGARSSPDDQFCRSCGTKLRRP